MINKETEVFNADIQIYCLILKKASEFIKIISLYSFHLNMNDKDKLSLTWSWIVMRIRFNYFQLTILLRVENNRRVFVSPTEPHKFQRTLWFWLRYNYNKGHSINCQFIFSSYQTYSLRGITLNFPLLSLNFAFTIELFGW